MNFLCNLEDGCHMFQPKAGSENIFCFIETKIQWQHQKNIFCYIKREYFLYISSVWHDLMIVSSFTGPSLKKHHTCGCCMPKQQFIAMVGYWKLHTIRSWHAISIKFIIGFIVKKTTGLEVMTLNCKKI